MDPLRKTSLVFGLFFAGTFVFSIPALIFYDSVLHDPGYILVGGFDARISTGALFEVLLAICNIATAIVIYPVAKRVKEAVALGYVASRIVESVAYWFCPMHLSRLVPVSLHLRSPRLRGSFRSPSTPSSKDSGHLQCLTIVSHIPTIGL
jgi:hypothetical protein